MFAGCGEVSVRELAVQEQASPLQIAENAQIAHWNGSVVKAAELKNVDFESWAEANGTNPICPSNFLLQFDVIIEDVPCRDTISVPIQSQPFMDGWVKAQLITIEASDYPVAIGLEGCLRPACSPLVGYEFNYQAPAAVDDTPGEDVLAHLFHSGFASPVALTFTSVPPVQYDPFVQDSDVYCDDHPHQLALVEVTVCGGSQPYEPTGGL